MKSYNTFINEIFGKRREKQIIDLDLFEQQMAEDYVNDPFYKNGPNYDPKALVKVRLEETEIPSETHGMKIDKKREPKNLLKVTYYKINGDKTQVLESALWQPIKFVRFILKFYELESGYKVDYKILPKRNKIELNIYYES